MPQQLTTPPDQPPKDFVPPELLLSPTSESNQKQENGRIEPQENKDSSVAPVENASSNGLVHEHGHP